MLHLLLQGHLYKQMKTKTGTSRNQDKRENKLELLNCRHSRHLPKHLRTEDIKVEDRNLSPVEPPGKYETE